jgi:hypothetical protein
MLPVLTASYAKYIYLIVRTEIVLAYKLMQGTTI